MIASLYEDRMGLDRAKGVEPLNDRHLYQITIDDSSNGMEFTFKEPILCKAIKLKGYSLATWGVNEPEYKLCRGTVDLEIDWLKVDAVETPSGVSVQTDNLRLPWEWSTYVTSNLSMDFNLALPTSTAMRKRFRCLLRRQITLGGPYLPLPSTQPFRLILYFEVVHDHIFR